MSYSPPPRPTGSDRATIFMQWVFDSILAMRPTQSPNSLTSHTTRGTVITPRAQAAGAAGTAGMTFKGEYDPATTYKEQHVVVIRTGTSAGTYVCVKDDPGAANPPAYPDTGIYWVSLSRSDTIGRWL